MALESRFPPAALVAACLATLLALPLPGEAQNAVLLRDIRTTPHPAASGFNASIGVAGGVFFFWGCDNVRCGLQRSDGTVEGTRWVADVSVTTDRVFPPSINATYKPYPSVDLNGLLVFAIQGEVWRTDGTTPGEAVPVLEITVPGSELSTVFTFGTGSYRLEVRACQAACGPFSDPILFSIDLGGVPAQAPAITGASVSDRR
jgi:hypothetical protein